MTNAASRLIPTAPSIPTSPKQTAHPGSQAPATRRGGRPRSPATDAAALPLSFQQEGLWFLDQMAGGGAPYNIHSATRYRGPLDVELLERSLRTAACASRQLARRVPCRRASACAEGHPGVRWRCNASACSTSNSRPADATETALRERIGDHIARPFDLSSAPLLRAELFRIAPDDHVLVLVVHHIVADGWSMSVIQRELGAALCRRAATTPNWPRCRCPFPTTCTGSATASNATACRPSSPIGARTCASCRP